MMTTSRYPESSGVPIALQKEQLRALREQHQAMKAETDAWLGDVAPTSGPVDPAIEQLFDFLDEPPKTLPLGSYAPHGVGAKSGLLAGSPTNPSAMRC